MKSMISRLLAATIALTAAGCEPDATVTVHYRQVANFWNYFTSTDDPNGHQADEGMFIMYKLLKIENTGAEAAPFVFDVEKVVTLKDEVENDTARDSSTLLNRNNVTTVAIEAGGTESPFRCFIKRAASPNPRELIWATVPIQHEFTNDQFVEMKAESSNIVYVKDALPDTLLSLCESS
ncbi:hypothetical protein [Sorangium sp. So ce388]|uniref:hypothetical protein n=1 Tax=Sorangium sp. So ce388 TaxID=3133309 RepID=UPI003F5B5FA1